MIKSKVLLNTIQKVKDFSEIVAKHEYEMDLSSGRYTVDAKSIMGVFSLNLLDEMTLTVHADSADDLMEEIGQFVVW